MPLQENASLEWEGESGRVDSPPVQSKGSEHTVDQSFPYQAHMKAGLLKMLATTLQDHGPSTGQFSPA